MEMLNYFLGAYALFIIVVILVSIAAFAAAAYIWITLCKHAIKELMHEAEYLIRRNQQHNHVTKESAMRSYEENERRYGPQSKAK